MGPFSTGPISTAPISASPGGTAPTIVELWSDASISLTGYSGIQIEVSSTNMGLIESPSASALAEIDVGSSSDSTIDSPDSGSFFDVSDSAYSDSLFDSPQAGAAAGIEVSQAADSQFHLVGDSFVDISLIAEVYEYVDLPSANAYAEVTQATYGSSEIEGPTSDCVYQITDSCASQVRLALIGEAFLAIEIVGETNIWADATFDSPTATAVFGYRIFSAQAKVLQYGETTAEVLDLHNTEAVVVTDDRTTAKLVSN